MSGLTEVFGGRIDFLETIVTGMTSIENGSDRYLLTDSKNRNPKGFLLHERFGDLWEKRCSEKENFRGDNSRNLLKD
jgi:hypothetical protein